MNKMFAKRSVRSNGAVVSGLLFLAATLAFWGLSPVTALAQSIDPGSPPEAPSEPQPQLPRGIEANYTDSMSWAEVVAECQTVSGRLSAEFDRLIAAIDPFQDSHPDYHAAEKVKIEDWLEAAETAAEAECQTQKDAAAARQALPRPTPLQIEANYHDGMDLAEVEAECEAAAGRISAEFSRLEGIIDPFQDSHPDYHAAEKVKIEDWLEAAETSAEAECQAQKDAAADRATSTDIDDLYPDVPARVKELANQLGLTDVAKELLYELDTELFDDPNDPEFSCNKDSLTEVYIYGCWHPVGEIKILDDNAVATTLAHELLHAIYYEYYLGRREAPLNALIDAATAANPVQTHIILQAYSDRLASVSPAVRRYIRYTELYAFIGTQFTNIPQGLEEHYAQYFSDRRQVLQIFHDWVLDTRAKLTERETYNQQLVAQLDEYLECLNDINALDRDCRPYRPDEGQYAAYDQCLASRKTFLRDCRQLRPLGPLAYQPPPLTQPAQPGEEPEDLEELIEETKQLAEQASEEQDALEESFVHQLVFHDHDIESDVVQMPEGEVEPQPVNESEPDDDQAAGESGQVADGREDDPPASDQLTADVGSDVVGRVAPGPAPGDSAADGSLVWLAWFLASGGIGLFLGFLLRWRLRRSRLASPDTDEATPPPKDAA